MSVAITFRPLKDWPGKPRIHREHPRFKASWPDTLALLADELEKLGARGAVLLADVDARYITREGIPYANATARTPGVVLEFEKRVRGQGDTWVLARFPCDTYWTWTANVRAIALTLEALRAVSRYGATQDDEQYRGFLALPGPGGVNTTAVQLSPERAARVLADVHHAARDAQPFVRDALAASLLDTNAPDRALGFADEARHDAHPDRGAPAGLFTTVSEARAVLYRHHGRQP